MQRRASRPFNSQNRARNESFDSFWRRFPGHQLTGGKGTMSAAGRNDPHMVGEVGFRELPQPAFVTCHYVPVLTTGQLE